MRTKKGFTLIELVVVIVILGILSAIAIPKFMDLQRDARISAVQGLVGAVKSSVSLVYSKSVLLGREKVSPGCIWVHTTGIGDDSCDPANVQAQNNDDAIFTTFGWPTATRYGLPRTLSEVPEEYKDEATNYLSDWVFVEMTASSPTESKKLLMWPVSAPRVQILGSGGSSKFTGCGIIYSEATATTRPELRIVRDDC